MKSVSTIMSVGLLALGASVRPAPALADYTYFTMTFSESGNCSSTFGTCASFLGKDPTGAVTGQDVLIFKLPEVTFSGNVDVYDPNGTTLSDRLAFIDPNTANPLTACTPALKRGCLRH